MTRVFSCGAERMAAPANETTPRIAATAKTGEDVARRRFELRITRDMFRCDLAEGERVGLKARIEERNLERVLGDGATLTDG
jgi:hypothetical protein